MSYNPNPVYAAPEDWRAYSGVLSRRVFAFILDYVIVALLCIPAAVVVFFLVCFFFAKPIYDLLLLPYRWAAGGSQDVKLIFTAPQELFFTYMNVALFGALFLAFPIIAGQIYAFVAPGLYKRERRAFVPYLVATPVFFILGALMVYFAVAPMALHWATNGLGYLFAWWAWNR